MLDSCVQGQAFRLPLPRIIPMPAPRIPALPLYPHLLPSQTKDGDQDRDRGSDGGVYILVGLAAFFVIALGLGVGLNLGRWSCGGYAESKSCPENLFTPHSVKEPPEQDLVLSPSYVQEKSFQTMRFLEILARTDPLFDPLHLRAWVVAFFREVQRCWQERDPGPVKDRMTVICLAKYQELIGAMRRNRELNQIEDLEVTRLEFVHVNCPAQLSLHEFAALITFEAKAYFVHEKTGTWKSGSRERRTFQEFWIFHRHANGWRLNEVKRSWDTAPLRAPNHADGLSDIDRRNLDDGVIAL
jgi:hypothetical protein